MKKLFILLIAAMILLTACAPQQSGPAKAELPAGKAYAEGREIYFVHTEASDAGVAEKLTDYLRINNIDVVNLGNYRSFEIENSIIIGRNEKIHNAKIVAAIVGLDEQNIIQQINPDYLLDVTFVLGKDYRDLIPLKKR